MTRLKHIAMVATCVCCSLLAHGRAAQKDTVPAPAPVSVSDSLLAVHENAYDEIFNLPLSLPDVFFMPPVYDRYTFFKPLAVSEKTHSGDESMRWLEDYDVMSRQMRALNHHLYFTHPELVRYNLAMLPEAPPQYQTYVDPSNLSITIRETPKGPVGPTLTAEEVQRRHWIKTFGTSLQFSQAYVSPNWYQGGNNNLNALGQIMYNVKLNEVFHPNLLFETTVQYKMGMNNAPEDSIHSYNISEDLFQVNTTFGIKAARRWYYSFTGRFKTQLVNSYKTNSNSLKSAFMSPGELTAGIGMTYSVQNKRKTFSFGASLAPLSYNLRTCLSTRMNPENFGIAAGNKTVQTFGSTAELKLQCKLSYNISLNSRLFAFSDYEAFQADWENTLAFEINKFLTTQIYAHMRYDTRTNYVPEEPQWKKLQIKEIFSIGLSYKFSSL